jgi:uncharacterized repeat protein (TIGR03803 family)
MQRMQRGPLVLFVGAFSVFFGFLAIAAPVFVASKEKVLYRFNGKDGADPVAGLIFDAAGNLYGTTSSGGTGSGCGDGCGTVFELAPKANGTWTETVLYSFCSSSSCADGDAPRAGLIFDATGNLFGTTAAGGAYGFGTVFELSPGTNGMWTEAVLHSFNNDGTDGVQPEAGVIFDAAGNLYGTNMGGGTAGRCIFGNGCGTVFELTPGANGTWTETVLHNFNDNRVDGYDPRAGVIFDGAGNLYGTTNEGGNGSHCFAFRCGTVFQLTPGANGTWTEKVLHNFHNNNKDGYMPYAGLIFDPAGNLYGTTLAGKIMNNGFGTVFQLAGTNGKWTEKVLHSFNDKDGYYPTAGLIFDAAGSLYGTTQDGGASGTGCHGLGCGTLFKLTQGTNGAWKETVVHSFGKGTDGSNPFGGPIFDAAGNLYGTTSEGGGTGCDGGYGCGTVFEVTP